MRTGSLIVAAVVLVQPIAFAANAGPVGVPALDPVVLTGTVQAADGRALRSVSLAAFGAGGDAVARAATGSSGRFRLEMPRGWSRLVLQSGARAVSGGGLPGWFRWQLELRVEADRQVAITLPPTRALQVSASDARGRPLPAVSVFGGHRRAVRPAALWPGGPVARGSQTVWPVATPTGFRGEVRVWAFPADDVGPVQVGPGALRGAVGRVRVTPPTRTDDSEGQVVVSLPTLPSCPTRVAPDLGHGHVDLVADLDGPEVRPSASRARLLRVARDLASGRIPPVSYRDDDGGDPVRYLFDEGVALRRVTGILGYAYAATGDPRYLDAMAEQAADAAGWPDWNPAHPLDTAQIAASVALAYGWSQARMTGATRAAVVEALVARMLVPYTCDAGALGATRTLSGNRTTVIAASAVLAGLAVRDDAAPWAALAVADGAAVLARTGTDDGTGRSVAAGPTVEGLMYTTYETAALALLHATRWGAQDPAVTTALAGLADLGRLAEWTEACGTAEEPDVEDAWSRYPWVDRPTALAALTAWPGAGGHALDLLDELQAAATLTIPGAGTWPVPDGLAELVASAVAPRSEQPPPVGAHVPGVATSFWGCLRHGELRAVVSAAPNDAAHAHRDVGNVVLRNGAQDVLADLGQRDYRFNGGGEVWRAATMAHTTVGLLGPDGRVSQAAQGSGAVTALDGALVMTSATALPGVDWTRTVRLVPDAAVIQDALRPSLGAATLPGAGPLGASVSSSLLLAAAPERVTVTAAGQLHFTVADGSSWELRVPAWVSLEVTDARPVGPYDDSADVWESLGPAHTRVTVTAPLGAGLALTVTVRRIG